MSNIKSLDEAIKSKTDEIKNMKSGEYIPQGTRLTEIQQKALEDAGHVRFNIIPFGPFVMHLTPPKGVVDFLREEGAKLTDLEVRKNLAGHLEKEHRYPDDVKMKFVEMMAPIFQGYRHSHLEHFGLHRRIEEEGHDIKDFEPQLYLETLWINYMREGEYNPPHIHSGHLSFVIYLDIPDMKEELEAHIANSPPPGSIQFMNELTGNEHTWKVTQQHLEPVEGEMVIFPAALNHVVFPYKTPGTRVSVSGNIFYTNIDKWPKYFF